MYISFFILTPFALAPVMGLPKPADKSPYGSYQQGNVNDGWTNEYYVGTAAGLPHGHDAAGGAGSHEVYSQPQPHDDAFYGQYGHQHPGYNVESTAGPSSGKGASASGSYGAHSHSQSNRGSYTQDPNSFLHEGYGQPQGYGEAGSYRTALQNPQHHNPPQSTANYGGDYNNHGDFNALGQLLQSGYGGQDDFGQWETPYPKTDGTLQTFGNPSQGTNMPYTGDGYWQNPGQTQPTHGLGIGGYDGQTYPSHTTIPTGQPPVASNAMFSPSGYHYAAPESHMQSYGGSGAPAVWGQSGQPSYYGPPHGQPSTSQAPMGAVNQSPTMAGNQGHLGHALQAEVEARNQKIDQLWEELRDYGWMCFELRNYVKSEWKDPAECASGDYMAWKESGADHSQCHQRGPFDSTAEQRLQKLLLTRRRVLCFSWIGPLEVKTEKELARLRKAIWNGFKKLLSL